MSVTIFVLLILQEKLLCLSIKPGQKRARLSSSKFLLNNFLFEAFIAFGWSFFLYPFLSCNLQWRLCSHQDKKWVCSVEINVTAWLSPMIVPTLYFLSLKTIWFWWDKPTILLNKGDQIYLFWYCLLYLSKKWFRKNLTKPINQISASQVRKTMSDNFFNWLVHLELKNV